MWIVWISPACCCFWDRCKFVQRFGVACPCYLSLCASCCDLGLFVCVFVLIIMGCSLLLSHFLFIVPILAPGSSLTSQGCLRCGNQGKLYIYISGVWSHLLTFEPILLSCCIFYITAVLCEEKNIFSSFLFYFTHASLIPIYGSKHLSASFVMVQKTWTFTPSLHAAKWRRVNELTFFGTFYENVSEQHILHVWVLFRHCLCLVSAPLSWTVVQHINYKLVYLAHFRTVYRALTTSSFGDEICL